jgi:two-component system sensor histidine kinase KdpD
LISVADDGPGLPAGDPERLFEKFQRGRSESNIVGVGLGLAICRAAARLHGGDIRACNNPGGGARFEISLPVATQAEVHPAAEPC